MAESNSRPPVAIRIVRPYDTEDQLLENELETIGKTNVVLIGAHPRPTGVILRFEVTLQTGATILRGEGRVLAHKENAFKGQAGLSLRFTRLDPKSKGVVDRATAMREAKSPSAPPRPPAPSAPLSDPAIADALTASTPEPSAATNDKATTRPSSPELDPAPAPGPALAPLVSDRPPVKGPDTGSPTSITRFPPQPPAVIADEARARARAAANAAARMNATRTKPAPEAPAGLTPPPIPADAVATPAPTPVTSIPGEVEINVTVDESELDNAVTLRPREPAPSAGATPEVIHAPPPPPAPRSPRTNSGASGSARFVDPPTERAELLARLRDRAGKLAPQRVAEILASRR